MTWLIDIIYDLVMSRMTGLIVMWSGTLDDIPSGWALCDGTNGTPDLKRKFIIGASITLPPGREGGELTHNHIFTTGPHEHDFTSDNHTHTHAGATLLNIGYTMPNDHGPEPVTGTTDPAAPIGTTGTSFHLPPYYSLAYIMKI